MKKLVSILLFFFVLCSCSNQPNNEEPTVENQKKALGILTVNDLHGAIMATNSQPDIALLAGEIEKQSSYFDDVLILSGGDMWQGTAMSNINRGLLINDVMNELKFDAMVIGNHEFDWGVSEISKFKDNNLANGEADFHFLAANIYENMGTSTETDDVLARFVEPYHIYERANWKIGVIGYIGQSQKYSIAASYVKDYDFKDPVNIVTKYAKELSDSCDIVIAYGHDADDYTNTILANSSYIDIVYNAHTHENYVDSINNKLVMQSGSNGNYLGVTTVTEDKVISGKNIKYDKFKTKNTSVEDIVSRYSTLYYDQLYGKINVSAEYVNRYKAATWTASVIRAYTGANFGLINLGGIRSVAFPVYQGNTISVAKVYDMMPFDNTIWLVSITGQKLKTILSKHEDYYVSMNYDEDYIDEDVIYVVACCDYIVDGRSDFTGLEIEKTGLLVRDAMIADIIAQAELGDSWYSDEVVIGNHYNN